jgi:gliding motility-associated-like protein
MVTVTVVPLPGLTVSPDDTIDLGQTVTISGVNEVPTIPINWYNAETGDLICTDCPTIMQQPNAPGEYVYLAMAVNNLGCGEEDTVTITVIDPCELEKITAANAFTPNGDGFNDYFEVRNDGVSNITLVEVFNRWGELVFTGSNTNDMWDGTFRDEPVNPGVYMYLIRGICQSEDDFILSGNVTVIR